MAYVDENCWDNFYFITLHVVDWELRRIVHTIDVPIDKEGGWPHDEAFETIGTMLEELEVLIQRLEDMLADGRASWEDIKI
jgi:hypothetical protein